MHILPFEATFPIFDRIPSPDIFCAEAKNKFLAYQKMGWLQSTRQKAVYIYQIDDGHRRHTGLVALNDVRDFLTGKVKKHEKTLSEREQRQIELFLNWKAILKPVLLTYPPVPAISTWLHDFILANKPLFETHFAADNETHRVWMATDPAAIEFLRGLFVGNVPSVYIADGHHRTSSLALLYSQLKDQHPELDFANLFCAFFAADQLDILDYNRVVIGLHGHTPTSFLNCLTRIFDMEPIENPRKPRKKFELKVFLQDHWYRCHWKDGVIAEASTHLYPHAGHTPVLLDVSLLNELVLHRLLGIRDVRTDARIVYIEGSKGLKGIRKAVGDSDDRVGFALHPVSFTDMMHMADANQSLPPKSTYFAPRLKSGILIKLLAAET